jgi:hypothetical protein
MDKLERKKMKTGVTWARIGDKCTKEFFQYHKAIRPKTKIIELVEGGISHRTPKDISGYVQHYYKELYRFDAPCEINIRAWTACLRNVPIVVTAEQNTTLLKPFSVKELEKTLKDLPAFKTACLDGIPTEIFKTYWLQIGPTVLAQMEEALSTTRIHPRLNGGLQSLIPKGG